MRNQPCYVAMQGDRPEAESLCFVEFFQLYRLKLLYASISSLLLGLERLLENSQFQVEIVATEVFSRTLSCLLPERILRVVQWESWTQDQIVNYLCWPNHASRASSTILPTFQQKTSSLWYDGMPRCCWISGNELSSRKVNRNCSKYENDLLKLLISGIGKTTPVKRFFAPVTPMYICKAFRHFPIKEINLLECCFHASVEYWHSFFRVCNHAFADAQCASFRLGV